MFEEQIQNIELFPVTFLDVLTNLIVALVSGIIIALVYRFIYRGPSYSVTYVNSLVHKGLHSTDQHLWTVQHSDYTT